MARAHDSGSWDSGFESRVPDQGDGRRGQWGRRFKSGYPDHFFKNIMSEQINIVDENDRIIGQDSRTNIHKKGLRHREIWVWLYNDKSELLFQLRSKNAETCPGLLDATAGGHVDLNNDYEQAAVREVKE